ncbi:MAG TPA: hypothetical protein PK677_13315 [Acidiphilium sp.]|nr:MAG: hypothetical protein B7Z67_13795 [Acidiphilium sp. 21-60-14]OZB38097.1 MAG: hypothetical protein B7X48_14470 [Acidiphilium sp. 34-60-192]HQT89511.1 hypothetical protein [Acidiphilium sp.]
MPRTGRCADCGDHRQPIGQYDRKRRLGRLRCRNENQGTKAPHRHGHLGQSAGRDGDTADIQDRDGAPAVIESEWASYAILVKMLDDGGYAGEKLRTAVTDIEGLTVGIVKRPHSAVGFVVLPKKRIAERTFA